MNNPNAPVLDRTRASGCGCFAENLPLPMGCAVCGHAPYAHGCPGQAADHEYAQPSGEVMAARLETRRRIGLGRGLPTFQPAHEVTARPVPVVPAPRRAEREVVPAPRRAVGETASVRTRPAGRTDARRPETPGTGRPHRPVEPREERAARLALAQDPLTRRRALIAARAPGHPPQNAARVSEPPAHNAARASGHPLRNARDRTRHPRPGEPAGGRTLTVLPDIPGTGDRHRTHRTSRPGLAVAPGRDHSPDAPSSWRHNPYRREVAA
ncbi:hypothetical protein [Streptosporangium sp. H16]|uniref:hypothetical protein n=1 Tax=Streptosporangium sp. H16 TaxID=3444184 RepID=UPI003F79E0B9